MSSQESLGDIVDELQERVDELERENEILRSRVDAIDGAVDDHDVALATLLSRELEKGAHLEWEAVSRRVDLLRIEGDSLERFETHAGEFVRLPGAADSLERSGGPSLAVEDLLPIQQLARLPDDVLAESTSKRPDELATRAWSERGNKGPSALWSKGSGAVRQFVDASDLAAWIRREEDDVGTDYAKKLASRTMDAIVELSTNRCYTEQRRRRQDGLGYKEKRLVLPADAEIPGETTADESDGPPTTAVVDGGECPRGAEGGERVE